MKRIAIVGVPGAGKTFLAAQLGRRHQLQVRHTDDLQAIQWNQQATAVAALISEGNDWILEGVTTVRGLRRWLDANDAGKPLETLIVMRTAREAQTKGRAALGAGTLTVLAEILPELRRRGVRIIEQ